MLRMMIVWDAIFTVVSAIFLILAKLHQIRHCEKFASVIGHCYSEDREDGEDIIFRQVK